MRPRALHAQAAARGAGAADATVDLTTDSGIAVHTNRTVNTGDSGQAAFFENIIGGDGGDMLTGNAANNGAGPVPTHPSAEHIKAT